MIVDIIIVIKILVTITITGPVPKDLIAQVVIEDKHS